MNTKTLMLNCLLLLSMLWSACEKTPEVNLEDLKAEQSLKSYLFIGHAYDWNHYSAGNRVDYRVEQLDFTPYHQIWLGGDICTETTQEQATLDYLDNLLGISSNKTHWALGNHDVRNRNIAYITDKTGRDTFYATYFNGITLVVLNTNFNHIQAHLPEGEDECPLKNEQYTMLKNVMDTISHSSHLVLLHHHSLLSDYIEDVHQSDYNSYLPNLTFSCEPEALFHELVYTQLVEVQASGVKVLFFGGDFGARAKEFEYITEDGITFLGSGINNTVDPNNAPSWVTDFSPDKILEVKHNTITQTITWQHHNLDSLLAAQN